MPDEPVVKPIAAPELAPDAAPEAAPDIAEVFATYPAPIRRKLLGIRALIFRTAAAMDGVGPLTEMLKWGEPAYLTAATKSGSTIRIGWKPSAPDRYFLSISIAVQSWSTGFERCSPTSLPLRGTGQSFSPWRTRSPNAPSHTASPWHCAIISTSEDSGPRRSVCLPIHLAAQAIRVSSLTAKCRF